MNRSVLFIIPSISYGGAEILLLQQIDWLCHNGWQVCLAVLSGSNDPKLIEQIPLPANNILVLNSPQSVLNSAAVRFGLRNRKLLTDFGRIHQVQNIVAHLPLAHFWGRLLKFKMPFAHLLVYHHSMQYQASPLNTFSKRVFNQVQKLIAAKTDDISVCISEAVKQNIQMHFVLKNPVVLFNAVPDKADDLGAVNSLPKSNSIRMVIPGRLHPAKGHLFFLNVFRELVQDLHLPLQLVIAGGGPLEQEIHQFLVNTNLTDITTVTGFLSNEYILKEIQSADLVLIPSVSEGLGIVAIEALMLGKTIVASDAGGLKEVIVAGHNGYLFKAGIHISCLNVMQKVLSDFPASLLPPANLREDYKHRFSFDAYVRKFAALLKQSE